MQWQKRRENKEGNNDSTVSLMIWNRIVILKKYVVFVTQIRFSETKF